MIWLVLTVLAPVAAAAIIALTGSFTRLIAVAGAMASLLSGLLLLRYGDTAITLPGLPGLAVLLRADAQTVGISLVVAMIASAVTVYAAGYFAGQAQVRRFFVTFLGFVAAMQLFVFSADYIGLLVAWELMAVASFLLIGYDVASRGSGRAAARAFLTTRTGDIGLYLAVLIIIIGTGSSELGALGTVSAGSALVAGILLVIAAAAKAAQVPFGGWLRDAMAGPTPVSALLHSATMVAAGVLLLVKVSPWLTGDVLLIAGLLGGLTAVVAGTVAACQTDLKRLLAASTSSQLGLMFLAVGAGAPAAATLHFAAHAFMKSSLFLGAGMFQHERGGTSFERLAGVGKTRRKTFYAVAIAGLALAGVPPLAGFWSKDAVIAAAEHSPWLLGLALLGSLLTGIYVAVALRQLWQGGAAQHREAAGWSSMGTALAATVTGVVAFGLFVQYLESLWGEVPASTPSLLLGGAAAAVGLAGGWWLRIAGTRTQQRVLRVSEAQLLERGTGWTAAVFAGGVRVGESLLNDAVRSVVAGTMNTASAVRRVEDAGIAGMFRFGVYVRIASRRLLERLQTGLVHQELAMSVSVALGISVTAAIVIVITTGGKT